MRDLVAFVGIAYVLFIVGLVMIALLALLAVFYVEAASLGWDAGTWLVSG